MSERSVADVVVRVRLDLSVLGGCSRLLVSRVLFNALHELFEKQSLYGDVIDPDFTGNLVFRGVPVVYSNDLHDLEYAFVSKQ